jgi:hypothetical protein
MKWKRFLKPDMKKIVMVLVLVIRARLAFIREKTN